MEARRASLALEPPIALLRIPWRQLRSQLPTACRAQPFPSELTSPTPPPVSTPTSAQRRLAPAVPTDPAASETAKLMMRIQLALNSRGYCNCKIDGKYGAATEKALKQFQSDQGLKPTGLPSSETLQKLGISF